MTSKKKTQVLTDEQLNCKEEHCDSYTRWCYQGDKLMSAAGHCRMCDRGHHLNLATGAWVVSYPQDEVTDA